MKLFISENIDKAIEGFVLVPIVYGEVDLRNVPENAASDIVAIDAVDSISINNIRQFITSICRALRLGGTIHIGGIDAYGLSRNLISGNIDLIEYNTLIAKKQGIYTSKYISDLLISHNLNIQSIIYKGSFYEITASRPKNKN